MKQANQWEEFSDGVGVSDHLKNSQTDSAVVAQPRETEHPKGLSVRWVRFVALDLVSVMLGFVAAVALVGRRDVQGESLLFLGAMSVSYIGWFWVDKLYQSRFISRRMDEIRRVTHSIAKGSAALVVVTWVFNSDIDRIMVGTVALFSYTLVLIQRETVRSWFRRRRRAGRLARNVVLVGGNAEAASIAEMIEDSPGLGYQVVDQLDPDMCSDPVELVTMVLSKVKTNDAIGAIVVASAIDMKSSNRLVRELVEAGVHVELSSTLADISSERLTVRTLGRFPVLYIEPRHRHGWRQMAKRCFDLGVTSVALVFAVPVMALIAIAIKMTSSGPVFFTQERVGKNGELFRVYKFRSMVVNAEEAFETNADLQSEHDGPLIVLRNDPRVTKIGKFLRKSSLDELPQLFNVIQNNMSLVGPRPALPSEMAEWEADLFGRLRVKPGITGMWQVSGRSDTSFEQYVRLDLYYVDNWSLFIDLAIMLKTIPAVIKSSGAY